ncbi:MAG: hypothetical protein ACI389_02370 [Methanobrevibacter sp.]|uniref:hypothetical protein n=1 Tax=Methanobrevibacter sp. TaxID=66852 RepID=UPI003EFD2EEC
MTENKRFELAYEKGNWWAVRDGDITLWKEEVIHLLNELHEENQLFHKINEDAIDFMYDNFDLNIIFTDRELNDICNEMGWELSEKGIKINQLEKENEQLKQFKEKVFTLINKEIARNEEAIEWGKETDADSGSMGFYNYMLNRLKKELEE